MAKKSLQELNLIDNFLFNELTMQEDKEQAENFVRYILETLLQRKFKAVKIQAQKIIQGVGTDGHGIQLDAYIETDRAEIVDIEPNKYPDFENEPKRVRYYHSIMDSKILAKGRPYQELKNVLIIFIVPYDPFGENRMMYTIKNHCVECPEICYNDGATTLYFYTKGEVGCTSETAKKLVQYFEDSRKENATSKELLEIQTMVDRIKCDSQIGVRYMSMSDEMYQRERIAREEGMQLGVQQATQQLILSLLNDKVITFEEGAKRLHISVEELEAMCMSEKV